MKMSEKIIRVTLIALIALSLFLSYNIWLSPASSHGTTENSSNIVTETQSYRNPSDAFLPLRMFWINDGNTLGTQSENTIGQIQSLLAANTADDLQLVVDENEEAFNAFTQIENGVELNYQSNFILKDYLEIYEFDLSEIDDELGKFYFSKVQIDFDNQRVNFMNYRRHSIYQLSFTGNVAGYQAILQDESNNLTAVSLDENNSFGQYDSDETISLKRYSYILSTQSFTTFRNAFFQNPRDVSSDNSSIYMSGQERLEIDLDNQVAEFKGELPLREELSDEFMQSFAYVNQLGSSAGNLRFFDRNEEEMNYRVFVEGYPVFSDNTQALVSVTVSDSGDEDTKDISIRASTNTIQVPIPADDFVELPSTQTVWQNIANAGGNIDKVASIIVGYTWEAIEDVTRVVDLTPEWYVRYDNQWYSERDLLQKLPEMEVE